MKHVVTFIGGAGSWAAAKRVAERHGTDGLVLLFSDTLMEDEDLYRFIPQAAANVGGQLVTVCDGRTPWQVFHDERFLGNNKVDPCSRILKRELLDRWLKDNCDPKTTAVYVGIDWTEEHRYSRLRERRSAEGWSYFAPLCEPPYLSKNAILAWLKAEGIRPPRLYEMGFPHNNCGGFCIKAGQAHFRLLLQAMPDRFAFHEQQEQEMRVYLNADVSILRDRTGGETRPMTLKELRERSESGGQLDLFEWGGCGCFTESEMETAP